MSTTCLEHTLNGRIDEIRNLMLLRYGDELALIVLDGSEPVMVIQLDDHCLFGLTAELLDELNPDHVNALVARRLAKGRMQ